MTEGGTAQTPQADHAQATTKWHQTGYWQRAKERSTYGPRVGQSEANGHCVEDARPGNAVELAAQRARRQLAGYETRALVEHALVAALGGLHVVVGLGPSACAARSYVRPASAASKSLDIVCT